jgi:mannose-6-phosphate isomerase-like protein (cupin superfamily)
MPDKINLTDKFALFSDHWSPKIMAELNNFYIKAVKFEGEFVWHKHDDTDELFWVIDGEFTMRFRDRDVLVKAGEFIIVPIGVEHMPVADSEVQVVLIEKKGTLNTGDAGVSEKTVGDLESI